MSSDLSEIIYKLDLSKPPNRSKIYRKLARELEEVRDQIKEAKINLEIHWKILDKFCAFLLFRFLESYSRKRWKLTGFAADRPFGGLLEGLGYKDVVSLLSISEANPVSIASVYLTMRDGDLLEYSTRGITISTKRYRRGTDEYKEALDILEEIRRKNA